MTDVDEKKILPYLDTLEDKKKLYPNLQFLIARSKNANIMCYNAMPEADKKKGGLNHTLPMEAFWLDIDPEYVKKNRAKGKMDDRVELGRIEKRVAYGCYHKSLNDGKVYEISLVAFPARKVKLTIDKDGNIKSEMQIAGVPCKLQLIFVHATDRTLRTPLIHWVKIYGIGPDGKQVVEKLDSSGKTLPMDAKK